MVRWFRICLGRIVLIPYIVTFTPAFCVSVFVDGALNPSLAPRHFSEDETTKNQFGSRSRYSLESRSGIHSDSKLVNLGPSISFFHISPAILVH